MAFVAAVASKLTEAALAGASTLPRKLAAQTPLRRGVTLATASAWMEQPGGRKSTTGEPRVRTVGFSVGGQDSTGDLQGAAAPETAAPLPVIIPPSFQVRHRAALRRGRRWTAFLMLSFSLIDILLLLQTTPGSSAPVPVATPPPAMGARGAGRDVSIKKRSSVHMLQQFTLRDSSLYYFPNAVHCACVVSTTFCIAAFRLLKARSFPPFLPQVSPKTKESAKGATPPSSAPVMPAPLPPKTSPRGQPAAQPPAQEGEKAPQEHQRPERPKLDRAGRRALQARCLLLPPVRPSAYILLRTVSLLCSRRRRSELRRLSALAAVAAVGGRSRKASSSRRSPRLRGPPRRTGTSPPPRWPPFLSLRAESLTQDLCKFLSLRLRCSRTHFA